MGSSTPDLFDLLEQASATPRLSTEVATPIEASIKQEAVISRAIDVTDDQDAPSPPATRTTPPNFGPAAYPHLFDTAEPAGRALACVRQAAADVETMLDALGAADLQAAQGALGLVAAATARASELADFDRGFSALVSFIRRATLTASAAEIDRQGVSALIAALDLLADQPIIGLAGAAEVAEELASYGWNGDSEAVDRLIAELLSSADGETTPQVDLFEKQA